MKKLYSEEQYKRWLLAKGRGELIRSRRSKEKRADRNRERQGQSSARTNRRKDLLPAVLIPVPSVFSLLSNPSGTVSFLNKILEMGQTRHIRVAMENIQALDPEAIAAFVAVMSDLEETKTNVSGNQPRDVSLSQRLHDFGFYEHVRGITSYSKGRGQIRKHFKGTQVHPSVAAGLLDFATLKVAGMPAKHGPSYNLLLEAMGNTFDHASGRHPQKKRWWASVFHDEQMNRVCFSVVDRGVGIIGSVPFNQRLRLIVNSGSWKDGEKLKRLLHGEVPSRTGELFRGRGLPNAYEAFQQQRIHNLVIVSNRAYANAQKQEFIELSQPFHGTIVYWEVSIP